MDISFRKGEGRKGGQNGQKIVIEQDENRESRKKIHERELAALKAEEMARDKEMAKEKARINKIKRNLNQIFRIIIFINLLIIILGTNFVKNI
jgi:hypothetical protein